MNRRTVFLSAGVAVALVVALILLMSGGGADDSSSVSLLPGAASRPATSPSAKGQLLPPDYAVLETRNPFGGRAGKPGGPEASIVFKGVLQSGPDYLGFFEDTSSKKVTRMKVGASVARGRIKSMDLDGLVYESPDGLKQIEVGQNLNGETPPPPPPPATQPAGPPPGGPPGAPPGPAGRGRRGAAPQQLPPQMPPGANVQMEMPPE